MQKITPFLWFDNRAEEAIDFYTSIFKDTKVLNKSYYGKENPNGKEGTLMTATFVLQGQEFTALNGGPVYKFTPAISFLVNCDTKEEVDFLWSKLTEGGKEVQCGWLEDKFGLSWQIVPNLFMKLVSDPDPEKSGRVMSAMMKMTKLDSDMLQKAYDGI
ncbi:MAG: VOC family protein [bacterium]